MYGLAEVEWVIVIRWERTDCFWNAGSHFAFVFAKCRGKQESPPSFILSNKERKKAQKNSFLRCFSGSGGRLYKGKVLAPFLSVVIHGLLGTCSLCFQKCFAFLVFVGFEKVCFENF